LQFNTAAPSPFGQSAQVAPSTNVFCTNCGNPVSEHAVACMSCGAKPVGHKKFCRQCSVTLNPEQVVCVKCGAGIKATGASRSGGGNATGSGEPKSKITAAILAFFLGALGIHWFYLGKKNQAISYLCVWIISLILSVFAIGLVGLVILGVTALIDGIKLLIMSEEDFDATYNT
jgi:TM2 domain-containing membrane protein YozV